MTTSVHKNLTGADLHEPKGADSALSGTVYVANGSGSGTWVSASSVITNIAFTTGDLKPTHKTSADASWILWSDGTIGDGSSGASIRANSDTAPLFAVYWNGYTNTQCPVSGGKGSSAAADYAAHKTITLPLGAGRVFGLAGSGALLTTRVAGDTVGTETVTLITANLPPYTPAGTIAASSSTSVSNGTVGLAGNSGGGFSSGGAFPAPTAMTLATTTTATFTGSAQGGTSQAVANMQPTTFINMMIKL